MSDGLVGIVGSCWMLILTVCAIIFSFRKRFFSYQNVMYYCTELSTVLNWICTLWIFSIIINCLSRSPPAAMTDGWFMPVQAVSSAGLGNAFLEHHDHTFLLGACWKGFWSDCYLVLSWLEECTMIWVWLQRSKWMQMQLVFLVINEHAPFLVFVLFESNKPFPLLLCSS